MLPETVRRAFRDLFSAEPTHVQAVSGGMINPSARVEVKGTRYFVKWKADAPPQLFAAEARGLALLRESHTFRIPDVIAQGEATTATPAYLILEWIDRAASVDQWRYGAAFGQALAVLHRVSADSFGLDHDNYIGDLPQINTPATSWPIFYRDQRLAVQMQIAETLGYLPAYREKLIRDLMERIETILPDVSTPSLLHGDLWSGNYFPDVSGQPVLFDPAVYYGNREVELAFAQLFGGGEFFQRAYQEAYPLDPGFEERRPLLQLYPLLVHLNHFGEQYGSHVDAICRYYLK
ncbi:MAG TPA: fructosamine kinase family protein [Phototrophicaceae bacterium]|nr:fructosamine kinase family protein [Phototrophicaceae bacterium]